MTEQPNEQPQIEKLSIDNPENFQFHAAYLVYEEAFDKARDSQAKTELNQNIQDLSDGKIDTETFYMNVSRFRKVDVPRQERFSVCKLNVRRIGVKKSNGKTALNGTRNNCFLLFFLFIILPFN